MHSKAERRGNQHRSAHSKADAAGKCHTKWPPRGETPHKVDAPRGTNTRFPSVTKCKSVWGVFTPYTFAFGLGREASFSNRFSVLHTFCVGIGREALFSAPRGNAHFPGTGRAAPRGNAHFPGTGRAAPRGNAHFPGTGRAAPRGNAHFPGTGRAARRRKRPISRKGKAPLDAGGMGLADRPKPGGTPGRGLGRSV